MRITELIAKLQAIEKEHDDVEVTRNNDEFDIEVAIEFVSVETKYKEKVIEDTCWPNAKYEIIKVCDYVLLK